MSVIIVFSGFQSEDQEYKRTIETVFYGQFECTIRGSHSMQKELAVAPIAPAVPIPGMWHIAGHSPRLDRARQDSRRIDKVVSLIFPFCFTSS